jgi:phytoene dehydrogenase-like protein
MPPSQVAAIIHAGIMAHYFEGGYHPRGGGMAIARAFVRALKRNGGEIRLNSPVKNIVIEKNKAVGIELESGERIHAAHVISNADPYITFTKLVGPDAISASYQRKLDRLSYSTSCLSLYLAVDDDLPSKGIDSGNYWYYDNADIDLHYRRGLTDYHIFHPPSALFVTCTSIKDPGKMHHGHHQLEAFTFCNYEPFSKWSHSTTGARDESYLQFKKEIAQRMISVLDSRIPGIREKIVFSELGTPLTNVHYLRNHLGNMYGISKSIKQTGPLAFHPETKIDNLFLCGSSTMGHGVAYSANTGITAASRILKCKPTSLWK